jgi:hypothetical protein
VGENLTDVRFWFYGFHPGLSGIYTWQHPATGSISFRAKPGTTLDFLNDPDRVGTVLQEWKEKGTGPLTSNVCTCRVLFDVCLLRRGSRRSQRLRRFSVRRTRKSECTQCYLVRLTYKPYLTVVQASIRNQST